VIPTAEASDGRHSLRLVKLRLVLTLVAVALVPLAAIAPIIRAVVDDPRVVQRERLAAQSKHVAAEAQRELTGVQGALAKIGGDPALSAALGAKPGSDATKAAANALAALVGRPSAVVESAALIDAGGLIHAAAGAAGSFTGLTIPLPGQVEYATDGVGGQAARLWISVGVPGSAGAPTVGVVVASVPLDGLLTWADYGLGATGQQLAMLHLGDPVAVVATHPDANTDPRPVLEVTGDPASQATGIADIPLPGSDGWQVVASAPATVAAVPLPALFTLIALITLLVGATWWLGRKILEPAIELETQRARFQDLYHTAREAALLDSLTGLGNHRAFQEALARMVDQARRYGTHFSLVTLDIDEFKRVNDTRGHAVGDELLAQVGDLIRSTIRTADAGFRVGGDEFALLLAETGAPGAEVTARRILSRGLEDRGTGRYKGPISFSAGVTACPEFGTTRVELTAQADAALYRGKRAGRTIVTVFDPAHDRGHVDEGMRSELSAAVSAIIESGAMTPVYQPIVHLPTGRILGYEGLVRIDPGSGFPHTGALFDAAEIAGRVLDLDRAALDIVLAGAHAVPAETLVSLNVSPRSFEAPEFNAAAFLGILRRHGMAPGRVLLELTERDAIRDPDRLREIVRVLQEVGVRVAADDVGAGNAGLRLLSQFRFDVVKIDLSLVQGSAGQDQTHSVLTSLVGLARRWGALTIAEGVETAAQLRMIRELEVDAGQGYLLGRPGAVVSATAIDLDALAGASPDGATGHPPAPSRPAASFAVAPVPGPITTVAPAPVPTAASVIAGNRPSLFSR